MRRTEVELKDVSEATTTQLAWTASRLRRRRRPTSWQRRLSWATTGSRSSSKCRRWIATSIGILQFSVTETQYDEQTLQQFAAKKQSYLAAEQAKAQRQEEYQQRLMVTERGLRQVAEIEAAENQEKKKATIAAEQKAAKSPASQRTRPSSRPRKRWRSPAS